MFTEREVINMTDTKLFIVFVVCNIINVIVQTVKSIATIKCGKLGASIINAVAYGFYTYIVILMVCELPLLTKCLVVGGCNLVGVFLVKWCEEKARKDKLWKVEATIPSEYRQALHEELKKTIPHSYVPIGKYTIFNLYCATQKDSQKAKEILTKYKAKYFVSESKDLY